MLVSGRVCPATEKATKSWRLPSVVWSLGKGSGRRGKIFYNAQVKVWKLRSRGTSVGKTATQPAKPLTLRQAGALFLQNGVHFQVGGHSGVIVWLCKGYIGVILG